MRTLKKEKLKSLRSRYIALASLLGLAIIIASFLGFRSTFKLSDQANHQIEIIADQLQPIREISNEIQNAYRVMDLYLLDPQMSIYRSQVRQHLKNAIVHTRVLEKEPLFEQIKQLETLQHLKMDLASLIKKAEILFDVRTSSARQYPSMVIANQRMQPSRYKIIAALRPAIAEAREEQDSEVDNYPLLIELQELWIEMVSEFRVYLINRIGSFNMDTLDRQSNSIKLRYKAINKKLDELAKREEQQQLGFDVSLAVEVLKEFLPIWYQAFLEVEQVHNSKQWRIDSTLMQLHIIPLSDHIAKHFNSINDALEDENSRAIENLNWVQQQQNMLLSTIILIFILYIIAMLITLEKMVFRPIAAVAQALKAEAFGEKQELLLHTRTRETQDLIDAFYEMNLQVRNRQMALEYQARHDALTGLPNRALLLERMSYQLMAAKREKQHLSLFILDLNRFKEVNDTLGHHVGDQLLINVGQRFMECLREMDTIARLGGDEFAVLLPNTNSEQSKTVAKKLIEKINEPFAVNENQLYIGVSIGIASYPADGEDHNTLMQHADVAMYNAKLNHLGYTHYNIDEDQHSVGRLSLIQDLRQAIHNHELDLYFQPKIDIYKNIPVGAEALLRWNHPTLGFIPPDQIVDIAEGVGLIDQLTSWVTNRAIAQCSACHNEGFQLGMSINLSVKNLLNSQLSDEITALLERHQLNSRFVTFEVTESSMMDNPENSIKLLNELSDIGVAISVDDFGTGFSSLAYLKQLPVNELKIDKSFVMEMERNDSDAVIVHSTIELGHNLGLNVVAEGVEDQQTCDILKHYGCDFAQGYFIAHPLPADEFMAWLRAHKSCSLQGDERVANHAAN